MSLTRKELFLSKFSPLHFGTSGIRAFVKDMTDMECYINTRGFTKFLFEAKEIKSDGFFVLGGDLRSSTPRIMSAIHKAIVDEGYRTYYCGLVPTPTLSHYAWKRTLPAIMVTGSHIPDDLNGIKFIKSKGEVLKSDEKNILNFIAIAREEEYSKNENDSLFDSDGFFKQPCNLPSSIEEEALEEFKKKFLGIFSPNIFTGRRIVLYEQSAIGRDLLKEILVSYGAEVVSVERSEKFIPIDTEEIPDFITRSLKKWALEYKPFAIVSTDGDSDRPLVADENGDFIPGDILGTLVSLYLKPDFASLPITSNDAAVTALKKSNIEVTLTKVGSPYCIDSMNQNLAINPSAKVVSWERNGGYLLGSNWIINSHKLDMLPTRDSILPILIALVFSLEEDVSLSTLVNKKLPKRFILANAVNKTTKGCDAYDAALGRTIIGLFSPKDPNMQEVNFDSKNINKEVKEIKSKLEKYFSSILGYQSITSLNYIDGIRIHFSNNDIVHLRPSSNSPEFRIYAIADTIERTDKIIADRLVILPLIINDVSIMNKVKDVV